MTPDVFCQRLAACAALLSWPSQSPSETDPSDRDSDSGQTSLPQMREAVEAEVALDGHLAVALVPLPAVVATCIARLGVSALPFASISCLALHARVVLLSPALDVRNRHGSWHDGEDLETDYCWKYCANAAVVPALDRAAAARMDSAVDRRKDWVAKAALLD